MIIASVRRIDIAISSILTDIVIGVEDLPFSLNFAALMPGRIILLLLFYFVSTTALMASDGSPISSKRPGLAISKTHESISIDGLLNEASWLKAQKANTFICNFPNDTLCAKTQTEAMVLYDDLMIYVGAICYDSLEGDFVIQSLKRDFNYLINDAFTVVIDPFDDKTNGFSFGVNPYGVQREGLIANGGNMGINTDWDNTWFSAVQREKTYWTVEIAIPFKSIRFKEGICEWGINFIRNDLKRNENSTWANVPRVYNISTLAFTGKLFWDEAPKRKGKNISLIPYLLNESSINYADPKRKIINRFNGGLDAKFALSTSLNLDVTVNPDFSQVEVDRQVTNLTRFNIFFPERRYFFLENSDLFSSFGFRQIRPFFSRKIGLKNGQLIPIYGGLRLSGKPNQNWRIGAMSLQTKEVQSDALAVASENYSVLAFQRKFFTRSFLSGILVHKQSMPNGFANLNAYNSVAGLDYNLASANNHWMGKFFYHYNFTPEKRNLSYAHASWLNYTTRKVQLEWNHEYVGKNYNPEVGFVPRNKQFNARENKVVSLSYWRLENMAYAFLYPKKGSINNHGPGVYTDSYYTDEGLTTDVLVQPNYTINFQNSASAKIKFDEVFTRFLFDVKIPGIEDTLKQGTYRYRDVALSINTNKRKKITGLFNAAYGGYLNGNKLSGSVELSGRIQPFAIISINASYDRIRFEGSGNTSVLALIGPRLEFTFTKSLFFTTFVQLNTQTNQINVNARFQWRFKPMSDLFVVYSDNSSLQPEFKAWLPQRMNRALVLKFVYWFNA